MRWLRVHTLQDFILDNGTRGESMQHRQLTDTGLSAQLLQSLLEVRHNCVWRVEGGLVRSVKELRGLTLEVFAGKGSRKM